MTITINTDNRDNRAPLYYKYEGQNTPQPVFIELDCRDGGYLFADFSGEIGGAVPEYYWNGLATSWSLEAAISSEELKEIFENEEFLACCNRIIDGFTERWDGSNIVGHYTDDAKLAIADAEEIIEECTGSAEDMEVWSVEDWLFTNNSLKDIWNKDPLSEVVADLEIESSNEYNLRVVGDFEKTLIAKAESVFCDSPDSLTTVHVAELLKRRKINQDEADDWSEKYGNDA